MGNRMINQNREVMTEVIKGSIEVIGDKAIITSCGHTMIVKAGGYTHRKFTYYGTEY